MQLNFGERVPANDLNHILENHFHSLSNKLGEIVAPKAKPKSKHKSLHLSKYARTSDISKDADVEKTLKSYLTKTVSEDNFQEKETKEQAEDDYDHQCTSKVHDKLVSNMSQSVPPEKAVIRPSSFSPILSDASPEIVMIDDIDDIQSEHSDHSDHHQTRPKASREQDSTRFLDVLSPYFSVTSAIKASSKSVGGLGVLHDPKAFKSVSHVYQRFVKQLDSASGKRSAVFDDILRQRKTEFQKMILVCHLERNSSSTFPPVDQFSHVSDLLTKYSALPLHLNGKGGRKIRIQPLNVARFGRKRPVRDGELGRVKRSRPE